MACSRCPPCAGRCARPEAGGRSDQAPVLPPESSGSPTRAGSCWGGGNTGEGWKAARDVSGSTRAGESRCLPASAPAGTSRRVIRVVRQLGTWSQAPLPLVTCGSHVVFQDGCPRSRCPLLPALSRRKQTSSERPLRWHASLLLPSFGPGPSPTGPTGCQGVWTARLEKGVRTPGSRPGKLDRVL